MQVLPLASELADVPGFSTDPVGDLPSQREGGIIQKYRSRVLIVSTGACGVHCRYCFRRHFPYSAISPSADDWAAWIEEIRRDSTVDEVILSGGDPLTLVDGHFAQMSAKIARVPQIRRLRLHSRMPIVIPERVTDELIRCLTGHRFTTILVVHANHPQELDDTVERSLTRLSQAGVLLLNQSVLLRGVNDELETLVALSRRLLDCRVMPYYLHQLDRVAGAAHFEVPVEKGMALIGQMRVRLPGYAVPRYAQEVPGEASKQVLA
jgi:EF-P beta-lysylation protein EpmB